MEPLLVELVALSRWLKVNALEALGPYAPLVTGAAYLFVAAVLLMLLVAGRGFWSPPTPELKRFPARIAGALIGLSVAWLYWSVKVDPAPSILPLAVRLIIGAVAAAMLYLFLHMTMCFKCQFDKQTYVKGLWLTLNAKKRLQGLDTGNQKYDIGGPPPANTREYFCGSKQDPYFVWPQASIALAQVLLFASYLLFIVPLTVGIACASMAMMQLDVRESAKATQIDLPTDVLFAFDEASLRPGASEILQKCADMLRARRATVVRVEGYTDARGSVEHNLKLSRERAMTVQRWLEKEGRLDGVNFQIHAFGKSNPIAPNSNPDGSDNVEGRQQNRRVTIVVDK
jgi:outer membrane protein OmpA-like peptidoglycan-associated protein